MNFVWDDWDEKLNTTSIRIRVTKIVGKNGQGPSFVFEASRYDKTMKLNDKKAIWFQVRIASLRSNLNLWKMGVFTYSPIEQAGSNVIFHFVSVGPKQQLVHHNDAGISKKEL